jgi:hypothetical protein
MPRDVLAFYRKHFDAMQAATEDPKKLSMQQHYWDRFVAFQQQTAERIFLTPALATTLLEESQKRFRNRKVKPKQVRKLGRKIMAGTYKETHQGIALTTENYMCDGQHRALAVLMTGIGISMWLIRNLPPDAVTAIDRGAGRTAAQDLQMRGEKEADDRLRLLRRMLELLGIDSTTITDDEEYDKWMPLFGDGIDFILPYLARAERSLKNAPIMGAIGFAYAKNRELVARFAEQVVTGEMLKIGDPAHTLRKYAHDHPIVGQQTRSQSGRAAMLTLKALFEGKQIITVKHDAAAGVLYFRNYYRRRFRDTIVANVADECAGTLRKKKK